MKKLNITISILFIMLTTNCMGMEVILQEDDSPKVKEFNESEMVTGRNIELKNVANLNTLDSAASEKPIYTDRVAAPKLKEIFDYIYSKNFDKFKDLLNNNPGLKLMTDNNGNNILMVAACHGDKEFIEFLLSDNTPYKINLNAFNEEGESAFIIACKNKNWDIVESLLNKLPTNSNLTKCFLEEGLSIIQKSSDFSNEGQTIKQLIENKLKIKN